MTTTIADSARKKFSEQLANRLREDFKSHAEEFREKRQKAKDAGESPKEQSALLLEASLPSPSCDLGRDLLEELQNPYISDVAVKVGEERFLCHRIVLTSRCLYFSAMMQNQWSEAEAPEITLNNIKPNASAALLFFLYGASPRFPSFCSLVDILQVSDMLGVSGLSSVAQFHIRSEMCHNFHRPCKDCIVNVPDAMNLATLFSLGDLHKICMEWNTKHFTKMWPTKTFASLPPKQQEKCLKAVMDSMSVENIIHLLMEANKLLSGITRVQWTKPVVAVATELMTSCCDFVASHFLRVTENGTVLVLFQGMGWKTDVIERILVQIADELTVDNVCDVHIATNRLVLMGEKELWNQEFLDPLIALKAKVWNFMVSSYYAVIHTESWHHVSSGDKMKLKSETLCQGDATRKLSKKPVLTSSLPRQTRKKETPAQSRTRKKESSGVKATEHSTPVRNNLDGQDEPPPLKNIVSVEEIRVGIRFCDVRISPPLLLQPDSGT